MLPDSVRRVASLCACFIAFLLLAASTFAQYRAGIQGSVLDPQGDTINAATVTLTNKETGRIVTVTTDASGVFNFLSLAPGHYSISASGDRLQEKESRRYHRFRRTNSVRQRHDGSRRRQPVDHRQRRRHATDRH